MRRFWLTIVLGLTLIGLCVPVALAQEGGDGQPVETQNSMNKTVIYRVHVQDIGWMDEVVSPNTAGTTGRNLGIEAFEIDGILSAGSGFTYQAHVTDYGWMNPVTRGQTCGTVGENKRVQAIKINLTGPDADTYDLYYRCHIADVGWLDWAKNGEPAGSEGFNRAAQAIEIALLPKGSDAPGPTLRPYLYPNMPAIQMASAHIQDVGWQDSELFNTKIGTTGQNHQLEAIKLVYLDDTKSGIEYITHLADIGWEKEWKRDGELSGTTGENRRIEAIRIRLTGEAANRYDIYYQAHVENYGWLDWAKNGEDAGTTHAGLKMECLNVVLVEKGGEAPGATDEPVRTPISETDFRGRINGGWIATERAEQPINSYMVGISDYYMFCGHNQTYDGIEGYYEVLSANVNGGKIRLVDNYTQQVNEVYISFKDIPANHLKVKIGGAETELVRGDTTDGVHFTFSGLLQYGQLAVLELKNKP